MPKTLKILLLIMVTVGLAGSAIAADAKRMTTDELKEKLNDPNVVILDARGSWDWVKTDVKIAGAVRVDPGSTSVWAKDYDKSKTIVLYCA